MNNHRIKYKTREWLKRYIPAEILGTAGALAAAWIVYSQTGSYIDAAAAGWIGEGIGFYGYFITTELLQNLIKHKGISLFRRITMSIASASTNLLVEFLPAEILDNLIIRPFLMYLVPHLIHPYPVGFLVGKFGADIIFYVFAIAGYETRKKWIHKSS